MKSNTFIVLLIFLIFFVISFLSNILGPIIPDIVDSFDLSIGLAGFLPFAFFVAYGIASIPSGILVEKYKEKRVLFWAFLLAFSGALLFAVMPTFAVALLSLFIIGIGMAMLQWSSTRCYGLRVVKPILPLTRLWRNFFCGASFLSPMLYSYLVLNVHTNPAPNALINTLNGIVPSDLKWVSLYWVFAVIALLMVVVVKLVKFPEVELNEDEKIDTQNAFKDLLGNRYVWLFFLGIFCYVGTEQGIANWISKFLQTYHNIDPAIEGASVISYFWGLLTIGCVLGLVLLKIFDSRRVLLLFTTGAIISLLVGLFGPISLALYAFPLSGFFASVMWSIIVSLALNSVPYHHGTFSGILCSGIAGGAVVPLVIGGLAEWVGLRLAMLFLIITLGYIFSIGLWAKPLVTNATIKNWKELFA
ncbi:MAG: MFS transporter [Spirosomataceae bacterium]